MTNISNVVCRVCESPDDLEMIFEKVNAEILKMLQAATPSDIKEDDLLPKHICIPCIFTLEDFYEFKSLYECTREKLKKKRINNVLIKESADNVTVRNDTTILEKKSNGVNELGLLVINRDLRLGNSDVSCDLNEDNCSKRLEEEAGKNTTNFDDKDQRSHIGKPETTKSRAPSDNKMGNEKLLTCETLQCKIEPADTKMKNNKHTIQLKIPRANDRDNNMEYKCKECGKLHQSLYRLKFHEKWHLNPDVGKCEICGKSYSDSLLLKKHIALHAKPDLDKEECGKSFQSSRALLAHKVLHTQRVPLYKCETCGESFYKESAYERHQLLHLNLDMFKCLVCGKSFKHFHSFKNHKNLHCNPGLYKCEECGKSFKSHRYFRSHKILHTNPDLYKCNECGKSYTTAENYRDHKAFHLNPDLFPYTCDDCGRPYRNAGALRSHKTRKLRNRTCFKCDDCGELFNKKSALNAHRVLHSNSNLYKCIECDKTFSNFRTLTKHKTMHSQSYPYRCKECGLLFDNAKSLKHHMVAHYPVNSIQFKVLYSVNQ